MKKIKNFSFTIFIIILSLILATFSHAFSFGNPENSTHIFAKFNSEQVSPGGTVTLSIDLSKIDYDDFKIVIDSDIYIGLPTVQEEFENVIASNFDVDNNELTIIGNKEEISVDNFILTYEIPSYISSGTTGNFDIYLAPYIDGEIDDTNILQNTISITIKSEEPNNDENKDNNQSENNDFSNIQNSNNTQVTLDKTTQSTSNNSSSTFNSSSLKSTSASATGTSITETVTYNGSSNNYLSELIISNYDLTFNFSKEHTSYFINVDNSVESIDITATAESSYSTVCIYGNDNLSVGTNKVLISVTSEDGSVRTYRIYVNRAE